MVGATSMDKRSRLPFFRCKSSQSTIIIELIINMVECKDSYNHVMPCSWKRSTIIPMPKIPGAIHMKDFRPVALTSVVAKCMERIVCAQLTMSVADYLDQLQFTYRARRGVEHATLVNLFASHLDKAGTSVRVLSMDMSAAFQTIQHHSCFYTKTFRLRRKF